MLCAYKIGVYVGIEIFSSKLMVHKYVLEGTMNILIECTSTF